MIINSGTIREAFQSFNTVFNKAFHEMEAQYPQRDAGRKLRMAGSCPLHAGVDW